MIKRVSKILLPAALLAGDYVKGPSCNETTAFKAQLILITGTGSIRG